MTRPFPLWRAAGLGAALLGLLLAGCAARRPDPQLYAWTDAHGNTRYTAGRDRIPAGRRSAAQVVTRPPADRGFGAGAAPADAEPFDQTPGARVREEPPPPPATAPMREVPAPDAVTPDAASPDAAPPPAPDVPPVSAPPPAPEAPPVAAAPPADAARDALDARIEALEQQVRRDEEALKALISDPETATSLRTSPALREISERLPALQAELRALRAQRAAASDG